MENLQTQQKLFHEYQWGVLEELKRFIAAIAGIQSGKTIVGVSWEANKIIQYPTDNHLIAAPTYKILNQSTLPKFFSEYPQFRQYYKKADSALELPTGGIVFIRSTEDPYSLEGMTLRSAWLDEAGQMKPATWKVIQARLSILRGQCLMTTTPYDLGWLYQAIYKPWKAGDPNIAVHNWSSEQNPFFPKEEFERVKATMDPIDFDMRYRGIFRKRVGLVYADFTDDMIFDTTPEYFTKIIVGIDWGFTNPAAIVVIGQNYDNHFWVLDEYYATGKTTKELINICKQFISKYGVEVFYADSAEPDRIQECRDAGLYVIEANKDIKLGVDIIRQTIRENRLHVQRECYNFLNEIENYHYPEQKENVLNKDLPEKKDDHLMDALRYAIYTSEPLLPQHYAVNRSEGARQNRQLED